MAFQTSPAQAGLAGLELVTDDLLLPTYATFAPGDQSRLFVTMRGTPFASGNATADIRVVDLATGVLRPQPFLTIDGIDTTGEGGLVGLAFHPNYESNGKFYVYYTATELSPVPAFTSYVREYIRSQSDPNFANPTFRPIISWSQPHNTHNGGWIGFGPNDGYLYIMSGDGGHAFDQGTGHVEPTGNAQDVSANFLGKVLRIDVDRDDFAGDNQRNYGIPLNILKHNRLIPGNPFAPVARGAVDPQGLNEIWAYGLRNPFRAGFDRATGDLWIGDVGQGAREEVDFQPAHSTGGENYGWRLREGLIQTPISVGGPQPPRNVDPVYDYQRPGTLGVDPNYTGATVVGGVPYRGPDPTLQGVYFFADASLNRIWTLELPSGGGAPTVNFVSPQLTPNAGSPEAPVAISEDVVGNLYITYLNSGSVYRIVTDQFTAGDFNGDASVDEQDVAIWSDNFGLEGDGTRTTGDANGDGIVDGADFLAWQQNFGWSPLNVAKPAAAPIPEPATIALAIAAFAYIARPFRPARQQP